MSFTGSGLRYGLSPLAEAFDKLAEAAMIAAAAYQKKIEKEINPEMKVNVQGPAPDVSWPIERGGRAVE